MARAISSNNYTVVTPPVASSQLYQWSQHHPQSHWPNSCHSNLLLPPNLPPSSSHHENNSDDHMPCCLHLPPQQTLNLTTCNNDTRRVEDVIIIGLPPCFGFVPPYLWLYLTGNVALNCAGGPTSCIYYLLCAQCTKYMLFATKSSGNGH